MLFKVYVVVCALYTSIGYFVFPQSLKCLKIIRNSEFGSRLSPDVVHS
jgi:hypothetical protein